MNILSIDFDWIMEPSIEAYNYFIKEDPLGPAQSWERIFELIPNLNIDYDLNKYKTLFFVLKQVANNIHRDNIYVGYQHHELYYFLKDVSPEEPITIYNIDHHHDLGYPENDNTKLNIGNWVTYINKEKKLQNYTWIRNKNSSLNDLNYNNLNQFYHTTDINIIDTVRFDKIFICASWEWVPLKYKPLFEILVSAIDKN